jgi:N-acetylglucosaminyldiphosphoundecaprenol N-acetyl-beta-D-mannosaminyltransferase
MEDHNHAGSDPREDGPEFLLNFALQKMPAPASHSVKIHEPGIVLGTTLETTSIENFTQRALLLAQEMGAVAVDFTNTQIVTMRRTEPQFLETTSRFDLFVPDATPLIWCLKLQGKSEAVRAYGPAFMKYFLQQSPATVTHFFLGASQECLEKLESACKVANPICRIVGTRNGYFKKEDEAAILAEINRLSPDFIWVGLGTPKQQDWIHRNKSAIRRGVLFAVGFAFDVNAGTKPDAPMWMHRLGLTWVFRMCSEPRRLVPRYLKYNSLFLGCIVWDFVCGRGWRGLNK